MKGSLHTDELMGEVVSRANGLRTSRRISHVFLMNVPTYHRPLLITDAAINIAPTLADKVDIIQNAIDLAHIIGIPEPKVAILSAVETVNPKIQSTLDAAALCKMADRGQITGGILDGPLAFDNAVSIVAAKTKGIKSAVAGHAEILVVPDLESGNMVAKQLEYLANALTAGIVLGTRVPIVLTSRADTAETRTASCVIAALVAHANRNKGVYKMSQGILTINAGSSSIKFALFPLRTPFLQKLRFPDKSMVSEPYLTKWSPKTMLANALPIRHWPAKRSAMPKPSTRCSMVYRQPCRLGNRPSATVSSMAATSTRNRPLSTARFSKI